MLEALIGAFGGLFIGATGVGAGSIIAPLLILVGYSPAQAVSSGFFVLIVAKSIGSATHWKMGHWPGRRGTVVIVGGIVGVLLASFFLAEYAAHVGNVDAVVKRVLGATLIAASTVALLRALRERHSAAVKRQAGAPSLGAAGAIVGALVCITSAGSGALLLLLLIPITTWSVAELAAVSNVFGLTTGAVSLAAYSRMTHLDWTLFLKVGIGIVPGVIAGVLLSRKIARRPFLIAFDFIALALGVSLLLKH